MKTLIIYQSSSGSTKKYAEEIANSVKADVLPRKKFKKKMIAEYDTIVFGGWVMGGKIKGADEFLVHWDDMKDKNVIVFSVGMSISTKEARQELISANLLDLYHLRFYMLRGDFDYQNLKFPYKFLFSNSLRLIEKDENASLEQKALLAVKEHPVYFHDDEGINKIISIINRLAAMPAKESE